MNEILRKILYGSMTKSNSLHHVATTISNP